jgi:HD-like signal output (HDOD) protein
MSEIKQEVIDQLKKCKELPSPPGVAAQIIDLSQNVGSDIESLAEVVSMDPVLSAKIIRMANSSLYMRAIETDSVQQAVSMFGWTGTLNIALSFSLVGGAKEANSEGLDYDLFWKRSLATAVACRKLGEVTKYTMKEELFLPGMLQDLGMLAIDKAIPSVYKGIDERQQDHRYMCALEMSQIEADHAAIGEWLLDSWRIPQKITQMVGLSHAENESVDVELDPKLIQCIRFSGPIADCIYCDEEYKNYMGVAEMAEKQFGLDITDFLSLIGKLTEEYQEMAALFDIDVGDTVALQANAENAKQILLKSMGVV